MRFVLLNSDKKRIRHQNGKLTPIFDYAIQALRYADKHGMHNARLYCVDKKKKKLKNPQN